jgi:hypothetical protein
VDQNLRRLVDRCERAGLAVSDDADFEPFFRLHEQTHARKGAPIYLPRERFARWFERLHGLGLARLFHARLPDGRPVASQVVLLGHPVTHTVAAASDAEHQSLGAAAFLRWRVFERLAALGARANDLTDASLNSVTRFKAQLGGDLLPCLVLESPETLRFRAGRALRAGLASLRAGRRAPPGPSTEADEA